MLLFFLKQYSKQNITKTTSKAFWLYFFWTIIWEKNKLTSQTAFYNITYSCTNIQNTNNITYSCTNIQNTNNITFLAPIFKIPITSLFTWTYTNFWNTKTKKKKTQSDVDISSIITLYHPPILVFYMFLMPSCTHLQTNPILNTSTHLPSINPLWYNFVTTDISLTTLPPLTRHKLYNLSSHMTFEVSSFVIAIELYKIILLLHHFYS